MFPVWSPDGTKLALLRLRGEPLSSSRVDPSFDFIGRELYVADVYQDAPTGIRKILELPEGEGFIVTPTWSPGGEWIAFGIEGGPHPRELYVVRTDGEESQAPRRVTKGAGVVDRLVWRATTPLLLP